MFEITCMLTLASTILIAAQATGAPARFEDRFEALEWTAPDGSVYRYRLYVPEGARPPNEKAQDSKLEPAGEPETQSSKSPEVRKVPSSPSKQTGGKRWPLLVWLHGHGERGEDNVRNLAWLGTAFQTMDDSPTMFILVTQHPADQSWFSSREPDSDFLAKTYKILERTIAEYPIDPDRVYASGLSSGGNACWELICRHPERFAAAVPMASSGGKLSRAPLLKDMPIWAFHSSTDRHPPPDGARAMVRTIGQAGGLAHLTETDPKGGWTHDCWTVAFQDHQAMAWMLAQRRGAWFVHWRPGSRPIPWGQIIAWLAVIGLVGLAWRRERRRRRRTQHEAQILKQTGKTIDELLHTNPFH